MHAVQRTAFLLVKVILFAAVQARAATCARSAEHKDFHRPGTRLGGSTEQADRAQRGDRAAEADQVEDGGGEGQGGQRAASLVPSGRKVPSSSGFCESFPLIQTFNLFISSWSSRKDKKALRRKE